jgi:hypothetical protein
MLAVSLHHLSISFSLTLPTMAANAGPIYFTVYMNQVVQLTSPAGPNRRPPEFLNNGAPNPALVGWAPIHPNLRRQARRVNDNEVAAYNGPLPPVPQMYNDTLLRGFGILVGFLDTTRRRTYRRPENWWCVYLKREAWPICRVRGRRYNQVGPRRRVGRGKKDLRPLRQYWYTAYPFSYIAKNARLDYPGPTKSLYSSFVEVRFRDNVGFNKDDDERRLREVINMYNRMTQASRDDLFAWSMRHLNSLRAVYNMSPNGGMLGMV